MKKNQARVIFLLSAVAFLMAFLVSARLWFRLDMTGGKAYTISDVSKRLYREIADTVTVTYFVSDRLAAAHPLPGEIADVLREYAAHSRGKIRFIQKDPAKAGLLRVVEELGIAPQRMRVDERNETAFATVYSGILIEYLDREAVIPLAFSLETLEYDLSARVRSLARNTEREVGVIAADGHKQWDSEYALLNRALLLSGFKVRQINPWEGIPESLRALFVFGGAEYLEEDELFFLDRYVRGGGSALFAADGVVVDVHGGLEARAGRDTGLLALLANYGVVVRPELVLDRAALNLTFQTQSGNGTGVQTVRYPHWIGVREEAGNPSHPVTARFGGLDLYWASPLELCPPPGVTAEILFTSTEGAWLQTGGFDTNPASGFENGGAGAAGTKILGACLSGVFPPALEGGGELPGEPPAAKPSRLIVIGDADFAGQLMQATRGEGRNLGFLLRAAEWLLGGEDLLALRDREGSPPRLDRVADPGRRDAAMAFSSAVNTVLIPLCVIIAGFFICRRKGRLKGKGGAGGL